MRALTPDFLQALQGDRLSFFFLLRLGLTDPLCFTDADHEVYHNGEKYLPIGFKFDAIQGGAGLAVDTLSISVDDTKQIIAGSVLNQDARNKWASIHMGVVTEIDVDVITDEVLASGTISRRALKISAAAGAAFVDPGSSVFQTAVNNHDVIEITSKTNGAKMYGFAKAAGTGETYGDELITNGDFEDGLTGWTISPNADASVVSDGAGGNWLELTQATLNTYAQIYQTKTGNTGYLLCANIGRASVSHNIYMVFSIGGQYPARLISAGESTDLSLYVNAWTSTVSLVINITARAYFATVHADDVSLRRVLAPSATGVTITSTPDGATYNWTTQEEGFNFYDAAGYDWRILKRETRIQTGRTFQLLFRGIVGGWELTGDNMAKIDLTNEMILWNKKPLRLQSTACPWSYRGKECNYKGPMGACDKTYEACLLRNNQIQFGGDRFLTATMIKSVWWGRYQVWPVV